MINNDSEGGWDRLFQLILSIIINHYLKIGELLPYHLRQPEVARRMGNLYE
jgi:hypothetical protein